MMRTRELSGFILQFLESPQYPKIKVKKVLWPKSGHGL